MPPFQDLPSPLHPSKAPPPSHPAAIANSAAASSLIPPIQLRPSSSLTYSPVPSPPPSHHLQSPSLPKEGGRVIFTRQLWQRSMPDEPIEVPLSRQDPPPASETARHVDANVSRRTSSSVSTRSVRRLSSPSGESRTPLTPEESPPVRSTRKRNLDAVVEGEDKNLFHPSTNSSLSHTRGNSGDSTAPVCICQPDPKIPRPRNAFILYRQHHQAKVIAQHPGLANPDISKIIGEQWRNQPAEVKNEWKALAEEEKLRHQQQYPTYRYQPKRNTRRNSGSETPGSASGDKTRCNKCGGRTILAPASYNSRTQSGDASSPSASSLPPQTPNSTTTPLSRTLPVLRELSLQSPAARRAARPFTNGDMALHHGPHHDDRDELGPLSPENKRRRYNAEQPGLFYRTMPPRYGTVSNAPAVAPGTPFPFVQGHRPHPYPPAQVAAAQHAHAKRESLPGLRILSPPGPMAPPPRPGMGYQQHRLSQGHSAPDRSLTLPPLQTATSGAMNPAMRPQETKSLEEVIMALPLSDRLEVLRRIAPPAPVSKGSPRGPLIAIEGDNAQAVQALARWLTDTLSKEEDMVVNLRDPPDVKARGESAMAMADYHVLAAEWLRKSKDLSASLSYSLPSPPLTGKSTFSTASSPRASRAVPTTGESQEKGDDVGQPQKTESSPRSEDAMLIDGGEKERANSTEETSGDGGSVSSISTNTTKPVIIIPTFSLHATNIFACRIPINDVYSPREHWQWSATLWRGIIGPDLTIYVRDGVPGDTSKLVEQSEPERLFVVKRTKAEGSDEMEIEGATLRRVAFEVSEWIRAHGSSKRSE